VTVLILKSKKKSKAKTRTTSKAHTRTKTKTHARPKPEKSPLDKAEKVVQPSLTLNTSAKTCQEVEVGDIGGFGSPDELEEHERRCIEQATSSARTVAGISAATTTNSSTETTTIPLDTPSDRA